MLIHFLYVLRVIGLRPQLHLIYQSTKAFSVSQLGVETGKSTHMYEPVRYLIRLIIQEQALR